MHQGSGLLRNRAHLVAAVNLACRERLRGIRLAVSRIIGAPQSEGYDGVPAAAKVRMPRRTRRSQVNDRKLRFVGVIVGAIGDTDGGDRESRGRDVVDRVRTGVA